MTYASGRTESSWRMRSAVLEGRIVYMDPDAFALLQKIAAENPDIPGIILLEGFLLEKEIRSLMACPNLEVKIVVDYEMDQP